MSLPGGDCTLSECSLCRTTQVRIESLQEPEEFLCYSSTWHMVPLSSEIRGPYGTHIYAATILTSPPRIVVSYVNVPLIFFVFSFLLWSFARTLLHLFFIYQVYFFCCMCTWEDERYVLEARKTRLEATAVCYYGGP